MDFKGAWLSEVKSALPAVRSVKPLVIFEVLFKQRGCVKAIRAFLPALAALRAVVDAVHLAAPFVVHEILRRRPT